MIEIRDLVFEYPGHRALHGVSLSIAAKRHHRPGGPQRRGQDHAAALMAALETPYDGRVTIDGLDTREAPRAIHERLGYLPDFFGLYDALSRAALPALCRARPWHRPRRGRGRGGSGRGARGTVRPDGAGRRARCRAACASAWPSPRPSCTGPRCCCWTSRRRASIPRRGATCRSLLLALRDDGMTLVVSSHILAELEDYSDRMVIVDHGRIAGGESIALKTARRVRLKLAAPRTGWKDFLKAQGAEVLEAGA